VAPHAATSGNEAPRCVVCLARKPVCLWVAFTHATDAARTRCASPAHVGACTSRTWMAPTTCSTSHPRIGASRCEAFRSALIATDVSPSSFAERDAPCRECDQTVADLEHPAPRDRDLHALDEAPSREPSPATCLRGKFEWRPLPEHEETAPLIRTAPLWAAARVQPVDARRPGPSRKRGKSPPSWPARKGRGRSTSHAFLEFELFVLEIA
jgi:hypothetical protein